jgi:hypothetical protein
MNIGKYGKHLSASEIRAKYSPLAADLKKIVAFFEKTVGSIVDVNKVGNMLHITAPRVSIEVLITKYLFIYKFLYDYSFVVIVTITIIWYQCYE